jgi:hypothetical protein
MYENARYRRVTVKQVLVWNRSGWNKFTSKISPGVKFVTMG